MDAVSDGISGPPVSTSMDTDNGITPPQHHPAAYAAAAAAVAGPPRRWPAEQPGDIEVYAFFIHSICIACLLAQ